ncbi:VPLPA-CTERM sorting domain-containing protein [Poseidonocella sedimentorum]|uniref:VPLPA-CTERM protein sorting domain-containing protein n=1 Tax=Poseidonocella sedimentorum TaxID=871652 RepID=A0A1I6CPJ9_9RHOB|nr:VPLPA-CTERM sorting domain-containing protein [Poseidonocella sedimentorum]SFQ95074.1 VPLPA-CTERM protein sorting domain-containing protein [Poseidonocella sedimentorum]
MTRYVFSVLTLAIALFAQTASSATLNEADFGEFGDTYSAPTNFTGYSAITSASNGTGDFEYFRFDSFLPGTTALSFTLGNEGSGSNMLIRLSSTPFSMAEWDWRIRELDAANMAGRELYANQWAPEDTYTFTLPALFDGPLFGFARFYGTNSASTLTITATGAIDTADLRTASDLAPVPLPGALPLLVLGLGAMGAMRARRKAA